MIDLARLEQYRENNRIEAKRALGGLPKSIWETYSAFANTLGGLILLGVEEQPDKSLRPVNLPDPEGMVREFWSLVSDPRKASVNILTENDVRIETAEGNRIIVIRVPRAQRYVKPVYVDGDPRTGSFWRSGEGDHRCTFEQIEAMRRDADRRTQDMRLVRELDFSCFDRETLLDYRRRMEALRPGISPEWEERSLLDVGAMGADTDGKTYTTGAGVLMLGTWDAIEKVYPNCSLRYTDRSGESGEYRENLYRFFVRVLNGLTAGRDFPEEVARGIREALGNCLINADYYSLAGVAITDSEESIVMTNPGFFRVAVDDAVSGGRSDPRNGYLMKMFNLIGVGESAGGGIPGLFSTWKRQGWGEPVIAQRQGPGRVILTLPLGRTARIRQGKNAPGARVAIRKTARKEQIIDYLTDHSSAGAEELAPVLGLAPSGVRKLLRELMAEDLVAARGGGAKRRYSLKW